MILKSKYMFESKSTRIYRHLASIGIIIISIFLAYTFVCSILLLDARNETKNTKVKFKNSPPDLIVVFTGGAGRIEFAIKKARELKQPNIFITGVNEKSSVQTILSPIKIADKDYEHIDLDYTAKNTVQNVVSTLEYLRNNPGVHKVVIVSSDYHIMRIKHIIQTLKLTNDKFEFYYTAVSSNYLYFKNIKILYTETFKLVRTKIYLFFLNSGD